MIHLQKTYFRSSKLKEAADWELNMSQKWNFYHKENNLEKEEDKLPEISSFTSLF